MFNFIKKTSRGTATLLGKWVGYSAIRDQHAQIKGMASAVLKPKSISQIKKTARVETFEQAKNRLSVTNKDISRNYYNYMYMFYFSVLMLIFCFGMLTKYLYLDQQLSNSIGFVGIFILFASTTIRYSFLCYQIKNKNLCSFNEYLDSSSIFPVLLGSKWYEETEMGDEND